MTANTSYVKRSTNSIRLRSRYIVRKDAAVGGVTGSRRDDYSVPTG